MRTSWRISRGSKGIRLAALRHVAALALAGSFLSGGWACSARSKTTSGQNGLTITPASATLEYQEQIAFQATATGSSSIAVTWSVKEDGCGSITQAGVYTAPAASATCHVVAQASMGGSTASATAEVTVIPSDVVNAVGMNLEGIADWEPQHFFADIMKSARYWYATWPTAAPVDDAGWPTGDANLCLATAPGQLGRAEPYKLKFTGRATLVSLGGLTVSNAGYDAATNTTTADLVIQANQDVNLAFRDTRRLPTDTHATGITGVQVITPGHAAGELFSRDLLARVSRFKVLRFMQALGEAGAGSPANPDTDWASRQKPAWPQQTAKSGIAWEYVVMLGNQTGKDVWINVPLNAADDYVTKLAQLFRYGSDGSNPYTSPEVNPVYPPLDPSCRIFIEYVNELWNGAYSSSAANVTLANNEYSSGNTFGYTATGLVAGLQRQARRTVEISRAFRAVFGDAAMMVRIRPVLCSQWDNWGTFGYPVQYVKDHYGAPSQDIYGIAGAPYVTVDNELQDGLSEGDVLAQMEANVHKSGGFLDQIDAFKALASGYDPNLRILTYEGGPGNIAGHSDAAKLPAQTNPRMGTMVHDLLAKWYAVTSEPFMYYTLCAQNGFGYFGLSTDITSESGPKWDAIKQIVVGQ